MASDENKGRWLSDMKRVMASHKQVLITLAILILIAFGGRFWLVGSENVFLKQLSMGAMTSLIGALVVFVAVDLILERKQVPQERAALRNTARVFGDFNGLIAKMAYKSIGEDWEKPDDYKDLYSEEVVDCICQDLDLYSDAPVGGLDINWYQYLSKELTRIEEQFKNLTI